MSASYPPKLAMQPASSPVNGDVLLPGSKSYTNRALLLAAMADGHSILREVLLSDDTRYMAAALCTLGITVETNEAERRFDVVGTGGTIPVGQAELFVGNSGTSARFLAAFLALGHGEYVVDGVERMRQRPIEPLLDALRQLGVEAISINGTGCPPLRIRSSGFTGGVATIPGDRSSQYFSALLMVGPLAREGLTIEVTGDLVSKPYIDLTADSMHSFGATMVNEQYQRFVVPGGQHYRATDYTIEPDASAASYFFALAAATGGRVRVNHLGRASAQGDLRFIDVLEQMGCEIVRDASYTEVSGPAQLQGVDVDMNGISDTVQTLAAIAPLAASPVNIRNVKHIRYKETDRLSALVNELRRLGVQVDEREDGLTINPGRIQAAEIQTYDDHRMAMSFAVLGTAVPGITILDPGCVAKTFPDFFERLAAVVGS